MPVACAGNQKELMLFLNSNEEIPPADRLRLDVRNTQGITLMHMAAMNGHIDLMRFLHEGCEENQRLAYNVRDGNGNTPMLYAAGNNQFHIVKFLSLEV